MTTTRTAEQTLADASAWWDTSIIDIHPGKIAIRGYPIEQLIGRVRFPEMIWLMLRGELPSAAQAELLEAALVPGVDHGPHAPSIAISRMKFYEVMSQIVLTSHLVGFDLLTLNQKTWAGMLTRMLVPKPKNAFQSPGVQSFG